MFAPTTFVKAAGIRSADLDHFKVMADWLDDRGERPLASAVRECCERPPGVLTEQRARLVAQARARTDVDERLVVIDPDDRLAVGLSPEDADRLQVDREAVSAAKVARYFPRNDQGNLPLGVTVLLSSYPSVHGPAEPWGVRRALWLCAASPLRRREPQVITVRLDLATARRSPHVWSDPADRWRWHAHVCDDEPVRYGYRVPCPGLPPPSLPLAPPAPRRPSAGALPLGEHTLSVGLFLLDHGRFERACDLFGVALSARLREQLDTPDPRGWQTQLRRALWASAPWSAHDILREEAARLAGSRRRESPRLRLFALPRQTSARRVSLVLTSGPDGRHGTFDLVETGSADRLRESRWSRSLELDLARCNAWGRPHQMSLPLVDP